MKYTTHYNLNKPEGPDLFNVEHFNENSTTIDNTLFGLDQSIAPMSGHISNQNNPHSVTKAQIGLGNVDNTSDINKPVSTAVQTELNKKANISSLATVATSGSYSDLSNKPTIDYAISSTSENAVQNKVIYTALSNKADTSSLATVATTGSYNDLTNLPTLGTAASKNVAVSGNAATTEVVMGNDTRLTDSRPASDVSAWAKASTKPTYTASEVGAYTTTEVDNLMSGLESGLDWKEAVATYSDIATTYPNPVDGWTVNVKDTDYTYRYDGSNWIVISANAIPNATTSVNGLMTTSQVTKLEGIATGAEVNQNTFSNILVGSTTIAADAKTDTLELEAGSNITLTPDATNDKVTITATDTTYESKTASQGGTDVSLVTTGEKYSWNEKADISDIPGVMTGATSSTDGAEGLVPKPYAADASKVLFGDGTWGTPPSGVSQLSALSDVAIASQTNGQALLWDSTNSKWVNGNVSVSSTIINATLAAGATTVTFTGIPTTGNNLIDFYAEGGLNYTAIDSSVAGQITLTYDAQSTAIAVSCEIREV